MPAITTWSAFALAARGDGAHARFGHQLDADALAWVCTFFRSWIQLGQIFDGIDVVVRRGRDQAHAGHAVAQLADVGRDLAAGQLAAFTGLWRPGPS